MYIPTNSVGGFLFLHTLSKHLLFVDFLIMAILTGGLSWWLRWWRICLQCGTWVWSLFGKTPWRRAWQPTPVFLPGELENPCGQRSLAGYSPWSCKESDMTEQLNIQHILPGIVVLTCISLIICGSSFPVFLAICMFSLGKFLFKSFVHFFDFFNILSCI